MAKPIIKLTDLGRSYNYYLQGFDVKNIGGNNILSWGWYNLPFINDSATHGNDFTGMTTAFNAMDVFTSGKDLSVNILGFDGDKIFGFEPVVSSSSLGKVHDVANGTGSGDDEIKTSTNPDMKTTKNQSIIYTSAHHLGIGYRFTASSATSTSLTVTSETFNATYGIDSDAGTNKIFNVTKKEIYTNTTNNPTDTLNFSAATTTPEAGDEFIVFVDNRFKFNVQHQYNEHFTGQDYPANWRRQMVLYGDDYFIANGNYLSTLNRDEQTFTEQAKQLPDNCQATCISVNNDRIMVGCSYKNGGKILLWDGVTDGWISEIITSQAPSALIPYSDGFMVMISSSAYITDGYRLSSIMSLPDGEGVNTYVDISFNGLILVQNKLLIGCNTHAINRLRNGIYSYDMTLGHTTFIPIKVKTNGAPVINDYNIALLPYSYSGSVFIYTNAKDYINKIYPNSSTGDHKVAILCIPLPQRTKLSQIELNIQHKIDTYMLDVATGYSSDISVAVSDGKRGLLRYTSASTPASTTSLTNTGGVNYPAYVGQEVEVVSGQNGATAGDRSFITDIANPNAANETWTLSPALTTAFTGSSQVYVYDVQNCDIKTITLDTDTDFINNIKFNIKGFYSDKIFVEIHVKGDSNGGLPIDILSLNIY